MKKILISLITFAMLCCFSVASVSFATADTLSSPDFYMYDKVQVRTVAGDVGCGIRFETRVKQTYVEHINSLAKEDTEVVFGTLIAPVEMDNLNFSTPSVSNIVIERFKHSKATIDVDGETYKYYYSDIIFDEEHCPNFTADDWLKAYKLELSAKSYVKYTDINTNEEVTVFATNGQTRSVFDASENVLLNDALNGSIFDLPELADQKAVLVQFLQVKEADVSVVKNTTMSYLESEWIDYKQVAEYSGNDYIAHCRAFPTTDVEKLADTKKIKVDGAVDGIYNAYIDGNYIGGVQVENELAILAEIPENLILGTAYNLVIKNQTNAYAQKFTYVTEAINTAEELLNVLNSYLTFTGNNNSSTGPNVASTSSDLLMLDYNTETESYEFKQRYYVMTENISLTNDQCRYGWSSTAIPTGTEGITNTEFKGAQLYNRKVSSSSNVHFYDVLDGNGYKLTIGRTVNNGIFGGLSKGAVLKNLDIIVNKIDSTNSLKAVLAWSVYDCTINNVSFEYTVSDMQNKSVKYVNGVAYTGGDGVKINNLFIKMNDTFESSASYQTGIIGGIFLSDKGEFKPTTTNNDANNIVVISSTNKFLYKEPSSNSSDNVVYAGNDNTDERAEYITADYNTYASGLTKVYSDKIYRYDTVSEFVGEADYKQIGSWRINADGTRTYVRDNVSVEDIIVEESGVNKYAAWLSVSDNTLTVDQTATISIQNGALLSGLKIKTALSKNDVISIDGNTITALSAGTVELKIAYQYGGAVKVETFNITVNNVA